ncbi:MAG: DUF1207 domain-containing protein, partial [Bacteroidetes bacterium]
ANLNEPRIGLCKFTSSEEMRVDVGNSIDLFRYNLTSTTQLQAGIDFFAYAFVTGSQGLRLQIDAVDGFFGGNISMVQNAFRARLRILHHSAHLVDGHYINASHSWIDNMEPIPYTQDFGELTLSWTHPVEAFLLRYYGGLSYAALVRPNEIERFAFFAGTEISSSEILGNVWNHPTNAFLAYQLSLTGEPVYHATHNLMVGIKFGTMYGKGISIYASYYNGTHMFGEYYNQRLETIGIGFAIDFF